MISYPASAGGTLTRVLEAGAGEDVVLFLHGVSARADRWRRNLAPVAAAGYRCIALDLPGHGFAQKGALFPYSVGGYAEFVGRFLADQKIARAHIVGTSLGAHIAATVACRHREMVRSLVLVGATGLFPIGPDASRKIAGRILERDRAGIKNKLAIVMHDASHITTEMVDEEWAINNSPGTDEAFAKLAEYFRDRLDADVVGDKLAALCGTLPMILVWGAEDRSVPLAIGQKAQRLLSGTPLRVISGAAHAPYFESPEAFNDILTDFIGGAARPD